MLSDLVVADAGDAERIARVQVPAKEFQGIDIKGIDLVKLTTLHSILTGRPYKELLREYNPIVTISDEGPWVFRMPPDVVTRLATLDEEAKRTAATKWAAIKEFALDGWKPATVAQALDAIVSLARKAEDAQQSVFFRMSL